jgi:uncharacterized membrane protein YraQ (UPF0718 family)
MLAFATVTYFREEQRFRESFVWIVIAIPIAFALWALLVTPGTPLAAIISLVVVAVAVGALFGFAYLETTVAADAVIVKFHGLWPTRRIRLDDIAEYAPMHYTMWDSGGWGVHFGLAGLTYNVSGNEGVHFRLTNGSQVLVGTQRPAELASAIATAMAARRTA